MAQGNPLKSSFNPQLITNTNTSGNVRIIDPNPLGEIVDHEDLYVYVNLTADQRSRSVLTEKGAGRVSIETDIKNSVNLVVPQQTTKVDGQDLFGPVYNLSTDWTEIGGPGNKKMGKDFEGFGITNVDIEIKSATTPKVVIDFVDVRGATLIEQGSCSPYGLFYNLPYPIFYLTVKGYYGKPVKYYLNLTKFNCKFNSDTGNMECRGEFIGWSFAFLSDIIVSYVSASQYLDNNKYHQQQYLRQVYEDTWKFYQNNNLVTTDSKNPFCDNPAFGGGERCCTIRDLLFSINRLNKNDLPDVKGSTEFTKLQNLLGLKTAYASYGDAIYSLIGELSDVGVSFEPSKAYTNDITRYERAEIKQFNTNIDNIFKKYFDKNSGLLSTNIGIVKSTLVSDNEYGDAFVTMLTSLQRTDFEDTSGDKKKLFDGLNDKPWQWNVLDIKPNLGYKSTPPSQGTITPGIVGFVDLGWILQDIEGETKKLSDKIEELRGTVIGDLNGIISNRIGFNPSIRNIFTVLTCNVDAFMRLLLDVSIKAEKYHDEKTKKGSQSDIQSGIDKVFSWPTYFKRNFKPSNTQAQPQGTKEAYPGTDFPNWVEVRFVEDFIKAFLEFQKDIDVLNDNKANKPGFDNYVPISPLESPLFNPDARIKYYDVEQADTNNIIGERLFVSLDHTFFQPIRLTNEGTFISSISREDETWNPFQNNNTAVAKDVAVIDVWNFLNAQEDTRIITTTCNQGSEDAFISDVKNSLRQSGVLDEDVKGSTLKKITTTILNTYGFKDTDDFYVYTPLSGGIQLNGPSGNDVTIKANPYDMLDLNPDTVFKIVDGIDGESARPINIIPEDGDFKKAINTYQDDIKNNIPSGEQRDFGDSPENPSNKPILDEKQKTITFDKDNLFITLSIKNREGDVNEWWKQSNLAQLNPSAMGQLTYWDYTLNNETYGIGFRSSPSPSDAYVWDKDNGAPGDIDITDDVTCNIADDCGEGVNDPFVTSPLWVDNVNKFRTAAGAPQLNDFGLYGGDTSKVERRNLAYLFLHTLKPAPLVIRHIDDNGHFYDDSKDASSLYSIKAFNTSGGIVKVPKAWLLTLGSQLWRWKQFVGTYSTGEWRKPLKGQSPNGFDLLSQPGFNGIKGVRNPNKESNRNNFDSYLDRIYGNKNWDTVVQKSSFSNDYLSAGVVGSDLSEGSYASFDYYAVYQLPTGGLGGGKIETETDKTEKFGPNNTISPWVGGSRTAQNATDKYNWPQLWIAPHHIPYVHPPIFDDKDEWEGSLYLQLFRTSIGTLDYQSFMPVTMSTGFQYYEDDDNKEDNTLRSKSLDGNLGAIMQFLPDKVKDIIVEEFERFCDNEWVDLLKIVDPANFDTSPNAHMTNSYNLYLRGEGENNKLSPSGKAGAASFLFKNEGGPQTVRNKLLVEQYWLVNSTPKIWYGIEKNEFNNSFIVSKNAFDEYLRFFYREYQNAKPKRIKELNKTTTQQEQELGNIALDDNDIKLSLYRTFKSLTDKWISINSSGKQFFNIIENAPGKCHGESGDKPTLATHFQYVNRAMGDIGNDAVIDVTKLNELKDNLKISLYQYISDLLTENEYMFFPLPAYINFTANGVNDEDLKDMFRPVMSLNSISCGPLFLSMYVGGNSRQLDLQLTSNCPKDVKAIREQNLQNDSFNFSTINTDFPTELSGNNNKTQDKGYTVFKVVYGLENQNHFKNIQLDQAEFSETSESLLAIDKLAQQGGTDQTTKGQNLNSVYLTRSYTCQAESFGNMMIQPMTYFDLFGVPMFNGAYLITEVRHNIKPNHATTTFKGVRQPKATIPIVTDAAAAMNMSLKGIEASKTSKSIKQIPGAGGSGNNKTTSTSPSPGGSGSVQATSVTGSAGKISTTKRPVIDAIIDTAVGLGIKDKNQLTALLTIGQAEGGFTPRNESFLYSVERYREVFKYDQVRSASDSTLKTILPNSKGCPDCTGSEEKAANFVYGGLYKNTETEGYTYRGRGLTQITFKSNYDTASKNMSSYFPGIDLVTNPEKANEQDVAVKMLVALKLVGQFGTKLNPNVNYMDQVYNIISTQDGGKSVERKNPAALKVYSNALATVKNDSYIQDKLRPYPDFAEQGSPPIATIVRTGRGPKEINENIV